MIDMMWPGCAEKKKFAHKIILFFHGTASAKVETDPENRFCNSKDARIPILEKALYNNPFCFLLIKSGLHKHTVGYFEQRQYRDVSCTFVHVRVCQEIRLINCVTGFNKICNLDRWKDGLWTEGQHPYREWRVKILTRGQ